MPSPAPRLFLRRGLGGAILCAVAGAVGAIVLALGFTTACLLISRASELDFYDEMRRVRALLIAPVVGCAAFCGCAGWATFAPAGRHRFATSLALVVAASVALSLVLLPLKRPRYKGDPDVVFSPSEAAIVFGPLAVVTSALTASRVVRPLKPCPIPE